MATPAATLRSTDAAIGAGIAILSAVAALVTRHWTVLLAPAIWAAIAWLSGVSLTRRFAAFAAATVLIPRYPLELGLSLDDLLPSAAAISGVVLLARWGWPRLPGVVEAAFGVWLLGGAVSAVANGNGAADIVKLAAPSLGRPVFWLVFAMTAAAIAARYGLKALLLPIAAVAIVESLFAAGAYTRCGEIHLGQVSHPGNEQVWESRRPLGVEQGAGTNVGEDRIRCRATGTLGQSSNFLAAYLVVALPVTLGATLSASGRTRWLLGAGTLTIFAAMILTFTRASLIASAVAVLVTLLFTAPRRAAPALLVVVVAVGVLALAVPQIRTRLSDGQSDRKALWYSGWLIFKDHAATGVGYGNYREVQLSDPKYYDTRFGKPTSTAHNGFIGIAAEGGVLQAGAVLALAGALLAFGWQAVRSARGSVGGSLGGAPGVALAAGAFGGVCGFLAQNMTNTLLLVPSVATYFWVLGGGLLGVATAAKSPRGGSAQPSRVGRE